MLRAQSVDFLDSIAIHTCGIAAEVVALQMASSGK